MRKVFLSFCCLAAFLLHATEKITPSGLMTDLLEHTDRVYQDGYLSSIPLSAMGEFNETMQTVAIASRQPAFSWIVDNGNKNGVMQIAYQIVLADNPTDATHSNGSWWNSGRVESAQSSAILYQGKELQPHTTYFWRVKYWDNQGRESCWSPVKAFRTAPQMKQYETPAYPLTKTDQFPESLTPIGEGYFGDFGKDAFGQLRLTLTATGNNDSVVVHTGERVINGRVNRKPAGTTRYNRIVLRLLPGTHTYRVNVPLDRRHLAAQAVRQPAYIGNVVPFRYFEIEGYKRSLKATDVVRQMVSYPFNDDAVAFNCSDPVVNQVWQLCHYSMKATNFCGLFVDGERERIPYEADALINQLSYYSVEREYTIARRTFEFLLQHPTWPAEWILQATLIAWYDYIYTGDSRALEQSYDLLKLRTLMHIAQPNNLLSIKLYNQTKEFHNSINYHWDSPIRDIVDWPQPGGFGSKGETDNFEFTDYSVVTNAYHYEALRQLAIIAQTLGKTDDNKLLSERARVVKRAINKEFFDTRKGIYKDGITATHYSLHGNMFPLAFEIVSEKNRQSVTDFVRSRGMACSVYGSQFLMDAVYNGYDANYGLQLLASKEERSWYNMIRVGSTITLEAWDDKYKPNQDWNHAWGAVPANTVARKLLGIEPLAAGFNQIRIRPQVASLTFAEGRFPTIKGDVAVRVDNRPGEYTLKVTLPANTRSQVWMPAMGRKNEVAVDGVKTMGKRDPSGKFIILDHIGSGEHTFVVTPN